MTNYGTIVDNQSKFTRRHVKVKTTKAALLFDNREGEIISLVKHLQAAANQE